MAWSSSMPIRHGATTIAPFPSIRAGSKRHGSGSLPAPLTLLPSTPRRRRRWSYSKKIGYSSPVRPLTSGSSPTASPRVRASGFTARWRRAGVSSQVVSALNWSRHTGRPAGSGAGKRDRISSGPITIVLVAEMADVGILGHGEDRQVREDDGQSAAARRRDGVPRRQRSISALTQPSGGSPSRLPARKSSAGSSFPRCRPLCIRRPSASDPT